MVLPHELAKLPITQTVVYSGGPRALQAIDVKALMALAVQTNATVAAARAPSSAGTSTRTLKRHYRSVLSR
jgi:hypothetical protein